MGSTDAQRRRERILAWGAVGIWCLLIFYLSTDTFSAAATSRLLGPLLDFLVPHLAWTTRQLLQAWVRKGAHVFEYAVLGWLTWRALVRDAWEPGLRSPLMALALVGVVASLDEAGQSTRPSRTGSARDVAIDVAGGALGLGLALGARAARARRPPALSLPPAPVP